MFKYVTASIFFAPGYLLIIEERDRNVRADQRERERNKRLSLIDAQHRWTRKDAFWLSNMRFVVLKICSHLCLSSLC